MDNNAASILVIEDDPFTASLLKFIFEREQWQVTVLGDGRAALEHLNTQAPAQVVVLDLMLPYVSGLEWLQHQRAHPDWADSRVVVLSAKDSGSEIAQAFAQGADDYLSKPFDPQELLARMRRFLTPSAAPAPALATTPPQSHELAAQP